MSDIKLKVVPLFPASTTATAGIRLDRENGWYKFSIDHTTFGTTSASQLNQTVLVWDGTNYFRVPLTAPASIVTTPSTLTVFDNATVGTVVGTLAVANGTGTYTFSLTSNPGGKYSITGNQLKVNAPLTAGTDTITIQANNGAGSIVNLTTTVSVLHFVSYAGTWPYYGF